ncbi:MAG: hypothetical protein P1U65_12250 [Minwuia sp.]|nr:hypothetical protein [Minwuia sp.]
MTKNFNTSEELEEFLRSVSKERLNTYLHQANGDIQQAITKYQQNTAISEAFYTPLQCLEICLRNQMNLSLIDTFGDEWMTSGGLVLQPDARQQIGKAQDRVARGKRQVSNGATVAELSFGFWVSLIGPRYDQVLWRRSLYRVFLHRGRPLRRQQVHGRLNALRRFRNRIAHHEPVFQKDLKATSNEILEAIHWMSPAYAGWTMTQSRVPDVLKVIARLEVGRL